MRFRDIIGQSGVKAHLTHSVQSGRVPHAYLFTGASGVGKLPIAIAYAQYINCPNRTAEDSCGVCPSCLQYQKLQHPDLHFVFPIVKPEGSSREVVCDDYLKQWREQVLEDPYFDIDDWHARMKAENKQSVIYEKESSEILRKLSLKPFGEGKKTMIIWLPEKMNNACANKLLKILEEPPQDTIFLLVSDEPQQLLSTILSRTQQVSLPTLTEDEVTQALREKLDLDISLAVDCAHRAEGSWICAKKAVRGDELGAENLALFQQMMRCAWRVAMRQEYDALLEFREWSTTLSKMGRERQKNFLSYCLRQTRENFIANYASSDIIYQTHDEAEFSERFARFVHANNVEGIMEQFSLAQRQIEQNGNAKIIFFDLALQMIVLIKKKP